MNTTLEQVLDGLMSRYENLVPDVKKITQALTDRKVISGQKDIENDHIAFRTMGVKYLGIASFEKIFLHLGYTSRDDYYFKHKKLKARWFAPPHNHLPRIFVSELILEDLPENIQKVICKYTSSLNSDPVDALNLDDAQQIDTFLHAPLWNTPTLEDYNKLLDVSEYAAWVIHNRYYLNHYTIGVHNLPDGYNTLKAFNQFLLDIGVKLSDAGGHIKVSRDGLLLQSATVSQICEATFACGGVQKISGSYVEFAERLVLPQYRHLSTSAIKRHHRRDGFETANADKIFESTFTSQTNK